MKEIARALVDALKAQPGLLALMVINAASLVFFAWVLHEISIATARDDALLTELVKKCSALSLASFSY